MLAIKYPDDLCEQSWEYQNVVAVAKISHQLRLLRNARLVKYRRTGKLAWYALDDNHVGSLLAQSIAHINHE